MSEAGVNSFSLLRWKSSRPSLTLITAIPQRPLANSGPSSKESSFFERFRACSSGVAFNRGDALDVGCSADFAEDSSRLCGEQLNDSNPKRRSVTNSVRDGRGDLVCFKFSALRRRDEPFGAIACEYLMSDCVDLLNCDVFDCLATNDAMTVTHWYVLMRSGAI